MALVMYVLMLSTISTICCTSTTLHKEHSRLNAPSTIDIMLSMSNYCQDEFCKIGRFCWGYEHECENDRKLFLPYCVEPAKPWASNMENKYNLFWNQGDFGYVKNVIDSLVTICSADYSYESYLNCSTNMRFCTAGNFYLDLTRFDEFANRAGDRYKTFREDIFNIGEIGGHCILDKELLSNNSRHKSPLQSWYAELEQYTQLSKSITNYCDEKITTPTVFIKLDAGINLYHHFCDFFNLYASLHVNGSFDMNINIIIWDTSYSTYRDLFAETWNAFTNRPVVKLADFAGKKICFKQVMFPLLARMRGGLYYNTYIVPGCYNSGLMMAFSKHIIQRLNVIQENAEADSIRVTLLRRSTTHRRIVNEYELVEAMKRVDYFIVRIVDYNWSDIFIGMHGAGLTHLIFLPDWAAVFEIYNTEDEKCYRDLARLRGVQYQTWENSSLITKEGEGKHPQLGTPHAKFTNYSFDVVEFMRIMIKLGHDVRERKRTYAAQRIFNNKI